MQEGQPHVFLFSRLTDCRTAGQRLAQGGVQKLNGVRVPRGGGWRHGHRTFRHMRNTHTTERPASNADRARPATGDDALVIGGGAVDLAEGVATSNPHGPTGCLPARVVQVPLDGLQKRCADEEPIGAAVVPVHEIVAGAQHGDAEVVVAGKIYGLNHVFSL